MNNKIRKHREITTECIGYVGRMLYGSKSGYRNIYPNNEVVFNANVAIESDGKIWYGDLDITKSSDGLKKLSKELNETVYVFRESDMRFNTEGDSVDEVCEKAIYYYKITPNKIEKIEK